LNQNVSIDEMNDAIHPKMVDKCLHEPPTDREREILEGLYDAELAYIDDRLASFYRHLQAEGKAENTVFVLLSDHGDLFGEWGLWGHQGRIHNRLCHVPLIVHYPWSDGGRESDIVSLRDLNRLFADIADPAQSEPTLATPGYAITEYFGWDTQLSFQPWEVSENHSKEKWGCYQVSVVMDDGMRLLWDANDTVELYDTNVDPDETTDTTVANTRIVSDLKQLIRSEVGSPTQIHEEYREKDRIGEDDETYGSETKEHLRELGYI
jgi:arylsulfatase A-like enzyme